MRQDVYRSINNIDLSIDVFIPDSVTAPGAVIFFHGGAWNRGTPDAFHPFCKILEARGMVSATAQYRLLKSTAESVHDCIADARAAVAWMREHASEFGFEPEKLAAGGGSAGGHLAACCGLIADVSWPLSRPDALMLFNPVVDQGPGGHGFKRIGEGYHLVSPIHQINKGCPPACFILGTEDVGLPVHTGLEFQRRMQDAGSRCDLHLFGGQSHGCFQPERERHHESIAIMLAFFEGLGYIKAMD